MRRITGNLHENIFKVKVKVKSALVQALRLCTGRTAYRVSRGIALPFHDHGTRRGWGVSVTPRPLFAPGKDPVPIVQEVGPRAAWTGAENLAPHRHSIPGPSSPWPVAIPTELPGPQNVCTFMIVSRWLLLRMRIFSDKSLEKIKARIFFSVNYFPKIMPFLR